MRSWLSSLVLLSVTTGVALVGACGGEVDPRYGPPDGLRNAHFPDPTATTPVDAGPVPDSGTQTETGATSCAVKFSTDIYPLITGVWNCSSGACHAAGGSPPVISATDSSAAYDSLKAYMINGLPYINPASTDPAKSTFECNIQPGTPCGLERMPKPGGTPATAAQVTLVDTWLKCGSPKN